MDATKQAPAAPAQLVLTPNQRQQVMLLWLAMIENFDQDNGQDNDHNPVNQWDAKLKNHMGAWPIDIETTVRNFYENNGLTLAGASSQMAQFFAIVTGTNWDGSGNCPVVLDDIVSLFPA